MLSIWPKIGAKMTKKELSLANVLNEIEIMFGRNSMTPKGRPDLYGPPQKEQFLEIHGDSLGSGDFYNPKSSGHWSRQNSEFRKARGLNS